MRIGLSYDLKNTVPLAPNYPEDALEEYDYPHTIELIEAALKTLGHSVVRLGGGRDLLNSVLRESVDIVFNIAEGRGTYRSREAQVPSVLEMLGIPYTGSDPQCLAVCLDKPLTKQIVALAGVCTPAWRLFPDASKLEETAWHGLTFPAIVKPAYEGSSKGIRLTSVVASPKQAKEAVLTLLERYQQPVMVEEFISGDEVTVGMVGNSLPRVIGMMRIMPRQKNEHFVYSLEVKRDWKALVDYEAPPRLKEDVLEKIKTYSLQTFQVLGCRDFARLDFRVNRDGSPYFLEINPLPGLGDYSDLVIMALKMGWTYEALIRDILSAALGRYPLCVRG